MLGRHQREADSGAEKMASGVHRHQLLDEERFGLLGTLVVLVGAARVSVIETAFVVRGLLAVRDLLASTQSSLRSASQHGAVWGLVSRWFAEAHRLRSS